MLWKLLAIIAIALFAWMMRYDIVAVGGGEERRFSISIYKLDRWTGKVSEAMHSRVELAR